jgi:endonuclease/exonuclease/phosphatase family metal-dependent hydrolase
MRQAACWLFTLLLCGSAFGRDVIVASYNIESYPIPDERNDGGVPKEAWKPEEEVRAVVNVLCKVQPDIVGLIEVGDESMLDDIQRRLKNAGLDYLYREWVEGADEQRHICLLSKFPIVERNSRGDVRFEMDGRRLRINRGILDVTVEINADYRLRLIGAHLKSRRAVPDYDQALMRAKEAGSLRQHINQILAAAPSTNLMVFGDLNDTKNQYPVREIIGWKTAPNHMMDLWLHDSRGERWTYYWKAADEYSRIDYLLVSPALVKEIIPEKCGINDSPFWNEASDHRAIFATVSPVNEI